MSILSEPLPLPTTTPTTPFLRWVGGKRTLKTLIRHALPHNWANTNARYFEPFVGGGAVTFHLADIVPGTHLTINDANTDLISTYRAIRDNVDDVIDALQPYTYRNTRDEYNTQRARHLTITDPIDHAAWFIYINKTSFNGIWRVNGSGRYNVPWGQLRNPTIIDEPTLRAASTRLQNATILNGSYADAVTEAQPGDLAYFDPPYLPLTSTSFAKYTKDDFLLDHQRDLAATITTLTQRGVYVILSNAYTELIEPGRTRGMTVDIYGDTLDLRLVNVARSVGAAPTTRTKAKEVIGFNYPPNGEAQHLPQAT